MTSPVFAYHRPFPWRRIGGTRTGRTTMERILRAYSQQNGLQIRAFFVETDGNLRHMFEDRTVGGEVMRRLASEEVEGIVVGRLEHIFSSAQEALFTLERWLDEGIAFHCAQSFGEGAGGLEGGGGSGIDRRSIRELTQLQRVVDLERTRQQIRTPASPIAWTGRTPFGFERVDGRLVEQEDRIARIVQMKSAYRKGRSYRQIAAAHGVSVATAHRLVRTDLRKLRRLGGRPRPGP
jgi:putative DNA-invertase from lambdoid prophage Rac